MHTLSRYHSDMSGVAGAMRGSVWFQVCGVQDDAERVGVEAYVLKKISNGLPLYHIPIALKWNHLSDFKLADSDIRTPARIAMVCCYWS